IALLSGTLKTYQRAACDEETMTLKCPPGTTILVEHAQYGRTGMHGISKCNSSVPLMITGDKPTNHTCIWPQSVQHSLLQMVVGVCQKKRQCKFNTDPKTFQGDPCPGLRKYIEVAYKCRPCKYPHPYTCRYTHTYVRTDACANVRERSEIELHLRETEKESFFSETSDFFLCEHRALGRFAARIRTGDIDEIPCATRTTAGGLRRNSQVLIRTRCGYPDEDSTTLLRYMTDQVPMNLPY
ncbi:EVA1C protein, partial [Acromyrmex insinuator]